MAKRHGAQHHFLGQFLGFAFHHQHAFGRAGDHEVERGIVHLLDRGVQDVFAVLVTHTGGADRAEERHAGERECRRTADQGNDIGVVFHVMAQHRGDDLHFVAEIFRKQRPDRAVDQAADQGFILGRPAFALEEPAGDLAGGECLFLVIHGQREKILAGLRGAHADGRAEHDGVAIADQHGAIGLAGHLAGFQNELAAAPVEFLAEII